MNDKIYNSEYLKNTHKQKSSFATLEDFTVKIELIDILFLIDTACYPPHRLYQLGTFFFNVIYRDYIAHFLNRKAAF